MLSVIMLSVVALIEINKNISFKSTPTFQRATKGGASLDRNAFSSKRFKSEMLLVVLLARCNISSNGNLLMLELMSS
jgi:hypothetical protein